MRNRFDQQLELLNEQLTRMGELCEVAIGKATTALKEGSMEQAQKVIEADEEIDQAETDIERLCLKLLLQQQPVARDLRQISAALKLPMQVYYVCIPISGCLMVLYCLERLKRWFTELKEGK